MRPLTLALLGLLGAGSLWAQSPSPPAMKDPGSDAMAWLRLLDSRIYTPPKLRAIGFSIRPRVHASEETEGVPAPYLVRYLWRQDVGDRVSFLGHENRPMAQLPGHSEKEMTELRAHYLKVGQSLFGTIKGLSLLDRYKGWRGRVVRQTVNGKEDIQLVLEPDGHPRLRQVIMRLNRDRLPWKVDKIHLDGERFTHHPVYTAREVGLVLGNVKQIHTPADPTKKAFDLAYFFTYQKVQGTLLLASTEVRSVDLPKTATGRTDLLNVVINGEVPEFKPTR